MSSISDIVFVVLSAWIGGAILEALGLDQNLAIGIGAIIGILLVVIKHSNK